jgi:hypothetical protein
MELTENVPSGQQVAPSPPGQPRGISSILLHSHRSSIEGLDSAAGKRFRFGLMAAMAPKLKMRKEIRIVNIEASINQMVF